MMLPEVGGAVARRDFDPKEALLGPRIASKWLALDCSARVELADASSVSSPDLRIYGKSTAVWISSLDI
jgi:hypothetical protein